MSLNKWAINKIKFYQKNKLQSGRCRHYPSCSTYGIECYEKFNFVKASFLTLSRIVRCNPLSRKVYDPVPKTKEEKKLAKIALNKELYFKDMLLNEHIKYPNMELVDDIVFCFVTSFPSVVKPDLINLSYKENLSPTLIRYIFDKPLESTNYNLDNNNYYLITDDLLNKFYTRIDIAKFIGISQKDGLGSKTEEQQQTIKSEFNTIFNNTITNDNDTNNSKKEEADKKIVYTKYEKKETKLNSYDLEVHIPHINISGEVVEKYNQEIENIFVDMAKKVLQSENNNVIYTVEYVANIQDDILSVMIKSNLKEGSKAQKVIIQTYNYDLTNQKEYTIDDMLNAKGITKKEANQKIKEEIRTQQEKSEELEKLGYTMYKRDYTSDMYSINNVTEYFMGKDNALYIIYAYGNENNTNEMDVVIM